MSSTVNTSGLTAFEDEAKAIAQVLVDASVETVFHGLKDPEKKGLIQRFAGIDLVPASLLTQVELCLPVAAKASPKRYVYEITVEGSFIITLDAPIDECEDWEIDPAVMDDLTVEDTRLIKTI